MCKQKNLFIVFDFAYRCLSYNYRLKYLTVGDKTFAKWNLDEVDSLHIRVFCEYIFGLERSRNCKNLLQKNKLNVWKCRKRNFNIHHWSQWLRRSTGGMILNWSTIIDTNEYLVFILVKCLLRSWNISDGDVKRNEDLQRS